MFERFLQTNQSEKSSLNSHRYFSIHAFQFEQRNFLQDEKIINVTSAGNYFPFIVISNRIKNFIEIIFVSRFLLDLLSLSHSNWLSSFTRTWRTNVNHYRYLPETVFCQSISRRSFSIIYIRSFVSVIFVFTADDVYFFVYSSLFSFHYILNSLALILNDPLWDWCLHFYRINRDMSLNHSWSLFDQHLQSSK